MATTEADWTNQPWRIPIDIYQQALSRVVIRPHEGASENSTWATVNVAFGNDHNFVDISGQNGHFRWAIFYMGAQNDSHRIRPLIEIDGKVLYPSLTHDAMNSYGFDTNTRPFQLYKYTLNGICACGVFLEPGIPFDDTLKIGVHNNSAANNVTVSGGTFYQTL